MQQITCCVNLKELMTYTVFNYPTAKALRQDFTEGVRIQIKEPALFPAIKTGTVYLEGPHYPKPHKWYLTVEVTDGFITKILK